MEVPSAPKLEKYNKPIAKKFLIFSQKKLFLYFEKRNFLALRVKDFRREISELAKQKNHSVKISYIRETELSNHIRNFLIF